MPVPRDRTFDGDIMVRTELKEKPKERWLAPLGGLQTYLLASSAALVTPA